MLLLVFFVWNPIYIFFSLCSPSEKVESTLDMDLVPAVELTLEVPRQMSWRWSWGGRGWEIRFRPRFRSWSHTTLSALFGSPSAAEGNTASLLLWMRGWIGTEVIRNGGFRGSCCHSSLLFSWHDSFNILNFHKRLCSIWFHILRLSVMSLNELSCDPWRELLWALINNQCLPRQAHSTSKLAD